MSTASASQVCRQIARDLMHQAQLQGHSTEDLRQALAYGARAHAGQWRKTSEPYILHPLLVGRAVQLLGGHAYDVLAALQHDVVEDCPGIGLTDIECKLGAEVAARVAPLTKDYRLPAEQRTPDAFGRLWVATGRHGAGVALIKLIDRAHNAASSKVLKPEKIKRMQHENNCMFAPLARFIGAQGLAQFLDSPPERWWLAAPDFIASVTALQPRLALT